MDAIQRNTHYSAMRYGKWLFKDIWMRIHLQATTAK
jgi:hypothetical protein